MPSNSDFSASFLGMGSNIDPIGIVHEHSRVQEMRERALSAYRNNIALPDVYIADRTRDFQAKVVGEDGEEMTVERRAALMREAGVKPMFDENGDPTDQSYVSGDETSALRQSAFDSVIESERLGKSAEDNREETRIIQPRELDISDIVGSDFDESTLASAQGDLHIPGTEYEMHRKVGCLYTSGCQDMADPEAMRNAIRDAVRALYDASGELRKGPALCETSEGALATAQYVMQLSGIECHDSHRFLGALVKINPNMMNEVRFHGDPGFSQTAGAYTSVFMCRKLYDKVQAQRASVLNDTTQLDVGDEQLPEPEDDDHASED